MTSNYVLLFGPAHSELLCVSIQRWAGLCPFPRTPSSAGRRTCKPAVREDGGHAALAEQCQREAVGPAGREQDAAAEGVVGVWSVQAGFGREAIN